jgi:hypothetical protein
VFGLASGRPLLVAWREAIHSPKELLAAGSRPIRSIFEIVAILLSQKRAASVSVVTFNRSGLNEWSVHHVRRRHPDTEHW